WRSHTRETPGPSLFASSSPPPLPVGTATGGRTLVARSPLAGQITSLLGTAKRPGRATGTLPARGGQVARRESKGGGRRLEVCTPSLQQHRAAARSAAVRLVCFGDI